MNSQGNTQQWVMNIVHTCMGLQRGEKVLLVIDEPLSYARDALLAEALKTEPAEFERRPLEAPPPERRVY